MSIAVIPDIRAIVDPLLGASYEQYHCWALLRVLFKNGWEIDLEEDPATAANQVQEVWFRGESADPLMLACPWDVMVMRVRGIASGHVGVMFNETHFVHTRKSCGVCLEPLRRWTPRLLQIARLRRLL
jgi:hypothetical protein